MDYAFCLRLLRQQQAERQQLTHLQMMVMTMMSNVTSTTAPNTVDHDPPDCSQVAGFRALQQGAGGLLGLTRSAERRTALIEYSGHGM